MSALRWRQSGGRGVVGPALFNALAPFGRFVPPRWLRRPLRVVSKLGEGAYRAPPYTATILSAVLLSSSATYGAYLGGHLDGFVQGVTARTGFAVDQIKVVGNQHTSEIDILDKLELNGWTSLIGLDVEAARERIASLPWVEVAAVRKVYPHTLEIRIDERQAFALWQQGTALNVIERSGRIIAPFTGGDLAKLPLIVGSGAPDHAPDLVARIDGFPELATRVKGYIRVGDRRWDIRLDNGITVKLPEDGVDQALADIVRMDRENGLLSRDVVAVDLRILDRVAVELSPEAATARMAALKQKPKALNRKPEKKI
ncbi:cell division protein FtsQ [Mesorhizobium sp. Root157]|uniref:cell division protein FtsQ/DivIB n=1 Tax=Mesorhizobium sp. Root157 TaxID=1736477 RepID=UPI0006F67128|nr:cell division protein FtsQ/DivIB [Mesorhizobium sp. Root157]KQZ81379.1 cell division protein FtsQ [Mesorhizobium sp. Root157]